ncbi:unnamed protein product [Pleuronectes platessa]|uniref:Uncharacterized protein n=1 Tax=Pleuronectes platessa TaxID=8262 RepID=A0A9N7Z8H6_PLEPL|nr:unnamed protein product [Pleuronectes platessa]
MIMTGRDEGRGGNERRRRRRRRRSGNGKRKGKEQRRHRQIKDDPPLALHTMYACLAEKQRWSQVACECTGVHAAIVVGQILEKSERKENMLIPCMTRGILQFGADLQHTDASEPQMTVTASFFAQLLHIHTCSDAQQSRDAAAEADGWTGVREGGARARGGT